MHQSKQAKKAILKTLIYSDIFHFPLTKDEIWIFLVAEQEVDHKAFEVDLEELIIEKQIVYKNGYYALYNSQQIIVKRMNMQQEVARKREIAQKIIKYLARVPSVLFIGVSGGLAVGSVSEEDDIDLFLITTKNTAWVTRMIILSNLQLLRVRRKKRESHPRDKICVNMIVDEETITIPKNRQDLYTAHEVAQVTPLLDKDNTYKRFLHANRWIKAFLPNQLFASNLSAKKISTNSILLMVLQLLEPFARAIQLRIMKKTKTTEIVTAHVLAFHPLDYRKRILKEYIRRVQAYGL